MKIHVLIALGGMLLAGSAFSQEQMGDRAAGQKVAGICRTCHGMEGKARIPIAPMIGGEPAAYIASQLKAFRSGARTHEMMSVVAASLSDTQIADVAAWYAGHEVTAILKSDPAKAPERCVGCHGADGLHQIPEAPNLAGENSIYIETQIKAFRLGKRHNDIMGPIAEELDDAAMQQAADWYAAIEIAIKLVPP